MVRTGVFGVFCPALILTDCFAAKRRRRWGWRRREANKIEILRARSE